MNHMQDSYLDFSIFILNHYVLNEKLDIEIQA